MNFRTHEEMVAVYESDLTFPYVVKGRRSGQVLVFVGTAHSNDPTDSQWEKVKTEFDSFKNNFNEKKHVFIEGGVPPLLDTVDETIVRHGDTGFAEYLAVEAEVTVSSPEPGKTEIVDALMNQGFSAKQIIAYYFARQLEQWARGDRAHIPDWEEYIRGHMEKYANIHDWNGEDLSLDSVIKMYEEVYGHRLDPENRQLLNDESNPGLVPVVSACGELRDQKLYSAILKKWNEGFDVFISYGSGHAIVMEPALRELIGE